jgi:alkylhydroperoxidase/carboxymuconolactone decarboxylase family protein YurZ
MSKPSAEPDWVSEWEAMLGTVPQLARDLREMSPPAEAGYRGLRSWIYTDRPEGAPRAMKELVMVALNVAEGNAPGALTHMRMGLEHGLTRTQLAEVLAQCFLTLGLVRFNSVGLPVWQAAQQPADSA